MSIFINLSFFNSHFNHAWLRTCNVPSLSSEGELLVHLVDVGPGLDLAEEDDGLLGLVVALDLVGDDEGDLGDVLDLVT